MSMRTWFTSLFTSSSQTFETTAKFKKWNEDREEQWRQLGINPSMRDRLLRFWAVQGESPLLGDENCAKIKELKPKAA